MTDCLLASSIPVRIHLLRGKRALLEHAPALRGFAERCGQAGAMHWLQYFFGGLGSTWKRPTTVLFLHRGADPEHFGPEDLAGSATFFEFALPGLSSGAFSVDDWQALRTVLAPPGMRREVGVRAVDALLAHGAQVVVASFPEEGGERIAERLQTPDVLWAESQRSVRSRLPLQPTYDATLARFGKKTRTGLRYYRKRLLEAMDGEFVPDATSQMSLEDTLAFNAHSLSPVSEAECRRRFHACQSLPGGYRAGLRKSDGAWLSTVGGWRQGTTTVVHHQTNAAGYEKFSLATVMRSFLIEHEIARGTRELLFYHGTDASIAHAFEEDRVCDLVVRRKGLRADLIRHLARMLASPTHYTTAHYLGGSSTFFAAALCSDSLRWQSNQGDRFLGSGTKHTAGNESPSPQEVNT